MEHSDFEDFSPTAMDHATHPRNFGALSSFDGHGRITGPCGDTMEFWLTLDEDSVTHIAFSTSGCNPSIACGSMATTLAQGKTASQVLALAQQEILAALGGIPEDHTHCALLAANTLKAALNDALAKKEKTSPPSIVKSSPCKTCKDKTCAASTRRPNESREAFAERQKLQSRLCRIKHKIVVLSGKGGVGKSTVSVNLATALAMAGHRVGLLDIDIHGPSIPVMLGIEMKNVTANAEGLLPIVVNDLAVMSIGCLLNNPDEAIIWRGPRKMAAIRQFLRDVVWGDLDYLIIDSPPGTGDEPLSICQLIDRLDGAIIVTTPQKVAAVDVRKSITFCRTLDVAVIGVVENMSGFVCPKCGEVIDIFPSGGGKQLSESMHIRFLGAIPMEPEIARACDSGKAFLFNNKTSPTAEIMRKIIKPIVDGAYGSDDYEEVS